MPFVSQTLLIQVVIARFSKNPSLLDLRYTETSNEFRTIMWFTDLDAVKRFVGDDYGASHVPPALAPCRNGSRIAVRTTRSSTGVRRSDEESVRRRPEERRGARQRGVSRQPARHAGASKGSAKY